MGITGAVLVSSSIRQQIKNRPEFELLSLGKFAFKNVAEPMTVYALANEGFAVPEAEQMKGKGEKVKEKSSQKFGIRMVSIGFLAMALGATLFWAFGYKNADKNQLLPADIRKEKVAVNVFENFTGDSNFDALGYLGSEWISSGLRELKVRTVSPEMVRQNKDKVGILPEDSENRISFAEITGAKYVITGSYFLEDDSIILNTRLNSTESGDELKNFPQLKAAKNQKEQLIEEARQYLLGYWTLKKDQQLPKISPPKYEAYQAYVNSIHSNNFDWGKEALAIDPNFFMARAFQLYFALISDNDSLFFANKAFIDKRWEYCTEYEKNHFKESIHLWEGNYELAFQAVENNYHLHPEDWFALHETGFIALRGLNRPDIAIQQYEKIFNKLHIYSDQVVHHSFRNYLDAINRQKKYQKAVDFYYGLSDPMKDKAEDMTRHQVIVALIYQNRIKDVYNLATSGDDPKEIYLRAAYAYSYIFPDSSENPFAHELRAKVDAFEYPYMGNVGERHLNWGSRIMAYYVLKEWEIAKQMLLDLRGYDWQANGANPHHPNQHEFWAEGMLGCIYAQQGNRKAALAQVETIQKLGEKYHNNHHSHFLRGETPYLLARIYAVLGDKEKQRNY